MASNLTITVDDEALKRARIRALEQGTSVNAILREFLEAYAGTRQDHVDAAERIISLARTSPGRRGAARWTRDELHERDA
ncbi:MAG: MerR family transcriptional regulator [Gemmatimonadales bacterium]|nr:MAG: MerR family transcriptional regulator [Gemmatimonadales bacterium]